MTGARTFWHLAGAGRKPSDYEITSTRLLYCAAGGRDFAVHTPLVQWYRRHQRGCTLQQDDWDRFRDPRETTYTRYTELQRDREVFVDGLFAAHEPAHDQRLAAEWLELLDRVLGPLRYPVHGLQMLASYVGSMAPGGRIVIACLLQSADEMRRIQRLAQRSCMLQRVRPEHAGDALARWQDEPLWQPLRALVEHALVVYDWDEALVALTAGIKPAFDHVFGPRLGELARVAGDELLQRMLGSLAEDAAWHRQWSTALLELLGERPEDAAAIERWSAVWSGRAREALHPFTRLFEEQAARWSGAR